MEREIVKIDEDLCNGCGDCVPNCHEGALQIIDGKARLISDLMCDGLGACIGHCPLGAISIEKREAEPYNETKVMKLMVEKGKNTVIAHLKHLVDHNEISYLEEGVTFLKKNKENIKFDVDKVIFEVHNYKNNPMKEQHQHDHNEQGGDCPGAQSMQFNTKEKNNQTDMITGQSELTQWPIQMHLINPDSEHFRKADVVIAADCVSYTLGNFHQKWLKGKALAIACPKLDNGQEIYAQKIKHMIDVAEINTLTVMIMQVPCCHGLIGLVQHSVQQAERKVPVKMVVVGIQGDILKEEWV